MISPDLKDRALKKIVDGGIDEDHTITHYASELECSPDELRMVIRDFEARHLISTTRVKGDCVIVTAEVNAHDFVRRGGFAVQEELLQKNIEKLLLEIESLKPSMPDRVEKITSIIGGISTALGFLFPNK
jgi:hypothetical protein